MPASRHKQLEVLKRREHVAELYVQGWTQVAIAEKLEVGQVTICEDLKKVRTMWKESAVRDFDLAREIELKKLDRMELEAWAAWERSKQPAQSAIVTGEDANKKTTKSVKNQTGDPRYLDIIHRCIVQRCSLLGLEPKAPLVQVNTTGDVNLELSDLRKEMLHDPGFIEYLRSRALDADAGAVCQDGQSAALEAGSPPGLPGSDHGPGGDQSKQAAAGDDASSARQE